jgi:hypothetical protein
VGSGFRIYLSDLGGAKGIRTPDLLHAISRQRVHHSTPVQVTVPGRAHQSGQIRTGCCTFPLYPVQLWPARIPFPRTAIPAISVLPRQRSRDLGEGPDGPLLARKEACVKRVSPGSARPRQCQSEASPAITRTIPRVVQFGV